MEIFVVVGGQPAGVALGFRREHPGGGRRRGDFQFDGWSAWPASRPQRLRGLPAAAAIR